MNTREYDISRRAATGEKVDGDTKFGVNTNAYNEETLIKLRGKCPVCGKDAVGSNLVYSKLIAGCEGQRRNADNTTQVHFCSDEHYYEYTNR